MGEALFNKLIFVNRDWDYDEVPDSLEDVVCTYILLKSAV